MSDENMREEFEDDMSSQGEWPQAIEKNADGGYRLMQTAAAWETWQRAWEKSRAALVVELPEAIEIWDEASYPPSSYAYLNLKSVIEVIKKTGAIVK